MDGSATHPPIPPAPPIPPPAPVIIHNGGGGPAQVIEAGGTLISKVGALRPDQAQTVAVMLLTIFICLVTGYLMWSGQRSQAETLALVIRSMEAESEKNRAATSSEFERNRATALAESKTNREAIADAARSTVASHQKLSVELGKLEQTVINLTAAVSDLKRKIPPQEEDAVAVPVPRLKETPEAP